jgi:histidinol phosphatase-like enzyme (inositol monophosphatase family)
MDTSSLPLQEYAEFAAAAARAAGEITLRYFRGLSGEGGHIGPPLQLEYKADHSPVTVADRESEMLLRQRIEQRYPQHGILGEEFGLTRPEAKLRWLVDPIDGTQSFIRGVPLYGVMLGLVAEDDALVGVVHLPALGESVAAWRGGGCWWNDARARVSGVARLEDAVLLTTDPLGLLASEKRAGYERLRGRVKMERGWGDCYGHVLVATGRAEIMLDPVLHEWDAAPLIPILEEAGGRFTDWRGRRTISGGHGFSTNGALYEDVSALLMRSG